MGGSFPLPAGFTPQGNYQGAVSGTVFVVAQTLQSVQVQGPHAFRHGVFFYNNSPGNCLVAFASSASLGKFTQKIPPSGSWSVTFPPYCGPISVTWESAGSGQLLMTETT